MLGVREQRFSVTRCAGSYAYYSYEMMYQISCQSLSHERRISSVSFTSAHLYGNVYMQAGVASALADSSDFRLLGEQSSPKWEIPYTGRRRTAVQNLTPLALSLVEKSVNVQSHKITNSNRYIHTLPIGMCG